MLALDDDGVRQQKQNDILDTFVEKNKKLRDVCREEQKVDAIYLKVNEMFMECDALNEAIA